jgi:hypothetical protein
MGDNGGTNNRLYGKQLAKLCPLAATAVSCLYAFVPFEQQQNCSTTSTVVRVLLLPLPQIPSFLASSVRPVEESVMDFGFGNAAHAPCAVRPTHCDDDDRPLYWLVLLLYDSTVVRLFRRRDCDRVCDHEPDVPHRIFFVGKTSSVRHGRRFLLVS